MEIKVNSVFAERDLKIFIRFVQYGYSFPRLGKRGSLAFQILFLILSLYFLCYLIFVEHGDGLFYGIIMLTFAVVYLVLQLMIIPAISMKAGKNLIGSEIAYTFFDNRYSIEFSGNGISGSQIIEYARLYRVCETWEYYYLYENTQQANIVRKIGLSPADAAQIREALRRYLPAKKYRFYKFS